MSLQGKWQDDLDDGWQRTADSFEDGVLRNPESALVSAYRRNPVKTASPRRFGAAEETLIINYDG